MIELMWKILTFVGMAKSMRRSYRIALGRFAEKREAGYMPGRKME
jgi:hypothetical protein